MRSVSARCRPGTRASGSCFKRWSEWRRDGHWRHCTTPSSASSREETEADPSLFKAPLMNCPPVPALEGLPLRPYRQRRVGRVAARDGGAQLGVSAPTAAVHSERRASDGGELSKHAIRQSDSRSSRLTAYGRKPAYFKYAHGRRDSIRDLFGAGHLRAFESPPVC